MKTVALGFDEEAAWKKLLQRDSGAGFFYAVISTGIFCRVGCGSRPPLRRNVRFFGTAADALAAGFRACQRCRPESDGVIGRVRAHLEANFDRAVPLAELAHVAEMSPFMVQRVFQREMGVSPLQYQRALRARRLRDGLRQGDSVTDAINNAGFGSSSRAYEAAPLGMAPARFAAGGKGERVGFATAQTPFGWMIVGATERGLCWLALALTEAEAEASLREEFSAAEVWRDSALAGRITEALACVRDGADLEPGELKLDLRGTVFQLRVWNALRQIPRGETRSYSELAREMGIPNATRAVARACATNRIAVLVPCHRVVGVDGKLTGYRWGVERKQQILEEERKD